MTEGTPGEEDAAERAEWAHLFAAPLSEFVRVRDRLAAELRAQGKRELAGRIKACPKPGAAAWAIDQLALGAAAIGETGPAGLERFVALGDDLAAAHLAAGAGAESRQRYEALLAEHRRLLGSLTDQALSAVADAGQKATGALRDRIATTLRAAAVEPVLRAHMLAGRLLRDAEPAGFEALAQVVPLPEGERLVRLGAGLGPGASAEPEAKEDKNDQKDRIRGQAGRAAPGPGAKGSSKPTLPEGDEAARQRAFEERQAALRRLGELKEQLRFCRAGLERARQNQQDQSRRLERAQATLARLEAELVDARKAVGDQQTLLGEADRRLAAAKQQEQRLMDDVSALQSVHGDGR